MDGPISRVFANMPNFGLALLLLFAGKVVYDKTTSYAIDKELTEKDNPAFGACMAGYLIGLALALAGALFGGGESFWDDMVSILVGGVLAVGLLRLSIWVNDKLILHRFSIDKEMISDRNVGTGAVVAGGCIATGLMLNGVLTGDSPGLFAGVIEILVYWLMGQLFLILGAIVFQMITSYDVHSVIGDQDNVPAGISFGGFLVALGIIVRASLAGASRSLSEELVETVVMGIVGLVLLSCARVIADKVFLPSSPLSKEVVTDRNVAAGFVAAGTFVSVAVILAMALSL